VLGACRATPDLVVMAYNIKHGQGMDGVVDLERVARVIEAQAPDVVTLQEVDRGCGRTGGADQAAWLAERLGMRAVFGPFMEYDGGEYGMALLSRLPVVVAANHQLPPGPEPRTALAVRVRLEDGREVVVVGVHLYRTAAERLAQARAMLAALAGAEVPVILAGDFNSRPGSEVMALIEGSYLNLDKGADRLTFDSVDPRVEIDHVLLRPATAFRGAVVDVLEEPVASDHRPLVFAADLR
jgi:endonuclease/exonuclease/phosphatase family metal-dependent hydrolase